MAFNPTLNNIRVYKNYGISVYGNTYDPIFTKGWINSTPNISISGTTCYLDYSNTFDTSDRTFLKKTFGVVPAGTTFYVSPVEYYDPNTDYRIYIGGTCLFQSTFNGGKIIIGKVIGGFTYTQSYNLFNQENFITTPQYNFTYTGTTGFNYILNSFPTINQTNLKRMGFLGNRLNFEEYIEFSGATGLNYGKLKIDSVVSLKDSQEALYLTGTAQNQDLTQSPTELKMYIRGSSDVDEIQKPQNVLGIYRIHNAENQLVDCYENQNEYQAHLRKQTLGSTYSGYWVQCETCPTTIYGEDLAVEDFVSNMLFDNLLFVYINTTVTTSFPDFTPVYNRSLLTQRNLTGNPQNASSLTFSIKTGLKIDLSHSSLQNWTFDIYIDPAYTVPLTTNFIKTGTPGFNNAFVLVQKNESTPNQLYCKLVGPSVLPLTLSI
jgi:hypothetical protein